MACQRVRLENGGVGFVCGLRAFARHCHCGREASVVCDWKVANRRSGTCDAPLCDQHSTQAAPGKHLCPQHAAAYEIWQRKHPDVDVQRGTQGELSFEVPA